MWWRAVLEAVLLACTFGVVLAWRALGAPADWPVVEPLRSGPAGLVLVGSSVVASWALTRRPAVDRALGAVLLGAVLAVLVAYGFRIEINRSLLVPYHLCSAPALLASARLAPVPSGPTSDPAWPELDPARMAKRALDLALASALLVGAAPLLAVLSFAIARDGGPVFFSQERVGLGGRRFRLWKLRSMVVDAEARLPELSDRNEIRGPAFKMRGDPRVTPVGRFLRRFSLDELPQLWNVLRGEMSLVGPRPPLPAEVARFEDWQLRRLSVPPGMTGLWQVSGRADLPWDQWIRLDLRYVDEWSPWLDVVLLLRTLPVVLRGTGAR